MGDTTVQEKLEAVIVPHEGLGGGHAGRRHRRRSK